MSRYTIHLLGGVEFVPAGAGQSLLARPTRLALLAFLAARMDNGPQQRDVILGTFWPESSEEHARNSLRQALHVLRRALGEDAILNRGTAVQLNEAVVECDLVRLDRALRAGRDADAVTAYRGHLLHGLFVPDAYEVMAWLGSEQERRRRAVIDAANRLAEDAERAGNARECLRWARRAAELHTPEERPSSRLMALLSQAAVHRPARPSPAGFPASLADALRAGTGSVQAGGDARLLRVAVIPLLNLTGDPGNDAIAEGFAAAIGIALDDERLDVERVSQPSLRQLQSTAADIALAAERLDAMAVLSGTLDSAQGELRLFIEMHARDGRLLWSDQMGLGSGEFQAAVALVRRAVADALPKASAVTRRVRRMRREGSDPAAVLSVMRGNHHLWRSTPKDLERALAHFTDATARDPQSAPAWAGLGQALLTMPLYGLVDSASAFTRARAALDRAIHIDPDYATGYAARAAVASIWEWDFEAAERLALTAHELDPADHEAWIVELLYVRSPRRQAAAALTAAARLVALDPVSPVSLAYASLGASYFDREIGEAYARGSLELEPSLPLGHWALSSLATWNGQHDVAREHARLLVELAQGNPGFRAFSAMLSARAGDAGVARDELAALGGDAERVETARYYVALTLAQLGDTEAALSALAREVQVRNSLMIYLAIDPSLAELRQHRGFEALRGQVGV
ncbi:MAG: hypothetical protein IT355_05930 [Gemmatimonadaceae bacterium]|nr:hypothetical protein [Gemmatimonadaceae bacterium]